MIGNRWCESRSGRLLPDSSQSVSRPSFLLDQSIFFYQSAFATLPCSLPHRPSFSRARTSPSCTLCPPSPWCCCRGGPLWPPSSPRASPLLWVSADLAPLCPCEHFGPRSPNYLQWAGSRILPKEKGIGQERGAGQPAASIIDQGASFQPAGWGTLSMTIRN